MNEWVTSLSEALNAAEPLLASALRLDPQFNDHELDGMEFEVLLGRFFTFQRGLSDFASWGHFGTAQKPKGVSGHFSDWIKTARARCRMVEDVLWQNLTENFGYHQINVEAARSAYAEVASWFQVIAGTQGNLPFHIVTTNFDRSAEIALGRLGYEVEDGFVGGAHELPKLEVHGLASRLLTPPGLKAAATVAFRPQRTVGVLHLHGAVGWYEREGQLVRYPAEQDFNRTLGLPALLPPDDNKAVSAFKEWSSAIWNEFQELLAAASHVIVIGHSLNDSYLRDALVDCSAKVLVGLYPGSSGRILAKDQKRIEAELPKAETIALRFGPQPQVDAKQLRGFLGLS
jgi:hypothetical protein